MTQDTAVLESADEKISKPNHSRVDTPYATVDDLTSAKVLPTQKYRTILGGKEVAFAFTAMSRLDYDALISRHQPTEPQLREDPRYDINPDTFPPALLAVVCTQPSLSEDSWKAIWTSKNWSKGELNAIYTAANSLCGKPVDLLPFD